MMSDQRENEGIINKNDATAGFGENSSERMKDHEAMLEALMGGSSAAMAPADEKKTKKRKKKKKKKEKKEQPPPPPPPQIVAEEESCKKRRLNSRPRSTATTATAVEAAPPQPPPSSSSHPFHAEYGDHFETPLVAYEHLLPALDLLAQRLKLKNRSALRVYDPFYCEGAVVSRLRSLGFSKVIHENVDFWAERASSGKRDSLPEFDVLVTNPPFSGDHKERIVRFCVELGKPWALLLPNYVANKSYYSASLSGGSGSSGSNSSSVSSSSSSPSSAAAAAPFYIAPPPGEKYQFTHPEGTGHDDSPFDSFWFVDLSGHDPAAGPTQRRQQQKAAARTLREQFASSSSGGSGSGSGSGSSGVGGSGGIIQLADSLEELRRKGLVPTAKRPNPRQRKALRQKR
jgi:hypothetical protein